MCSKAGLVQTSSKGFLSNDDTGGELSWEFLGTVQRTGDHEKRGEIG